MEPGLVIVLVVLFLVTSFVVLGYNRFIRLRQLIRESWSGIDVELRRRYDLIPNLVQTVQAYAAHERAVLESVTAARAQAASNTGAHDSQIADEAQLVGRLRDLLAVAEAYPDLKADQQFLSLQRQLAETEDRLAAVRRLHNANVRDWNTLGETIPWSVLRSFASWEREPYFEVEGAVRTGPPPGPAQGGWTAAAG